ncbi:hypothetical protein J3R82DRAFT_11819 [Butyriboletus roseoflavus]|nr:hypothetical protein J3R82DRAFT_11819 [Butyriboletus roseoflavus]
MSLRINTNVPPVLSRVNHSVADGGYHDSAGRTFCSPRTSPFRCKQTPRGSRKAHTFASITNTELHQASPTWQPANQNAGDSPRGRSISLFSPRSAAQNNLNYQVESLLPYNAETPHSPRGNLSGRRPHNETFDSALLSLSATFPTSSLSHSALDMLLKAEATLDPTIPTQESTCDSQGAMSNLDVPNSSLSRRSSRSSARNQRMRSGEPKWDKSRFSCASPCPSIVSSTSASSSSTSSACIVTATCSTNSTHGSTSSSAAASLLTPSPTDRSRRSPPPDSCPPMVVQSTTSSHMLSVILPRVIQPEMVTVAAKKGDRLDVVADAWHMERDCHYEWQIRFTAGDVDMSTVRARFGQDGNLTIEVQRQTPGQSCPPRLGMGFRYSASSGVPDFQSASAFVSLHFQP